jgi:hypothetical protein
MKQPDTTTQVMAGGFMAAAPDRAVADTTHRRITVARLQLIFGIFFASKHS